MKYVRYHLNESTAAEASRYVHGDVAISDLSISAQTL